MVSPKLASHEFASNPPAYSKMRHLFLKIHQPFSKSAGFSENSLVLAQKSPLGLGVGGGGMAWVALLFPLSPQ
jgi:hypothetical protein